MREGRAWRGAGGTRAATWLLTQLLREVCRRPKPLRCSERACRPSCRYWSESTSSRCEAMATSSVTVMHTARGTSRSACKSRKLAGRGTWQWQC